MQIGADSYCQPIAAALITLLWLALPLPVCATPDINSTSELHFKSAEFVTNNSADPPGDGWKLQRLPDDWERSNPGYHGIGWYRIRFKMDAAPTQALALYVARVVQIAEFRLNGSVLNPEVRFTSIDGRMGTPMTNIPVFIVLPTGLFEAGENVLLIRFQDDPLVGSYLSEIRIGPPDDLKSAWLMRNIPQRTIPHALLLLIGGAFFFSLIIWIREPAKNHAHFLITLFFWCAGIILNQLPATWFTRETYYSLFALIVLAHYWTLLSLIWCFTSSSWHWFPKLLNTVSGTCVCIALAIIFFSPDFSAIMATLIPSVVLRLLTTAMLIQWACKERNWRSFVLVFAELIWMSGSIQIIAIALIWLPPDPFILMPADALPIFLVLLFLYAERLVLGRIQAVREQHIAIANERERLLQNVHDGLGSQLVMALRLARRENADINQIACAIDDALQDMRLIVDTLDAGGQDLPFLLGALRHRLQPQLASIGTQLKWEIKVDEGWNGLSSTATLELLRVVQEALNNSIKHAKAEWISLSLTASSDGLSLQLSDNGLGFDAENINNTGRGMTSIRQRTKKIGAGLKVHSSVRTGTVIDVKVPNQTLLVASSKSHAIGG